METSTVCQILVHFLFKLKTQIRERPYKRYSFSAETRTQQAVYGDLIRLLTTFPISHSLSFLLLLLLLMMVMMITMMTCVCMSLCACVCPFLSLLSRACMCVCVRMCQQQLGRQSSCVLLIFCFLSPLKKKANEKD